MCIGVNLSSTPLPRRGEGSKRIWFLFSPGWEKGLGDEGGIFEQ
ncbi:hypothetical protein MC7420_6142 [Coleofasciculus chthonoplastes PCC 7420]|uniref:Uncharacterized protein n=1 Tax=Coleofasciculus chthonoplastes PCC 7420 TaxID=118168 RepID=B4VTT5_9CYAN|nr:hypothetical protein MC7420_6142 [Coleofasciculus chthonoplastes PCC 7420]